MGCLIFLVIFVLLPVLEFMFLGYVAQQMGFWDTFFLVVLSIVFGLYLVKHQGRSVLIRIQQCLMEGRLPTLEMVDGGLIFAGGLLFVFPGFISDGIGFLCVFPLTRWLFRSLVVAGFRLKVKNPSNPPASPGQRNSGGIDRGKVVDAEVIE